MSERCSRTIVAGQHKRWWPAWSHIVLCSYEQQLLTTEPALPHAELVHTSVCTFQ